MVGYGGKDLQKRKVLSLEWKCEGEWDIDCSIIWLLHATAAFCCCGPGLSAQQQQRTVVRWFCSKCEQCHVVRSSRKLNTDLFELITQWHICRHLHSVYWYCTDAFSAMTLLVWCKEEHPVCKKLSDEVLDCWCRYLCGARCRLFAYGPADSTAILKPHHFLPRSNPEWFYLSDTGLPRLSWKRGRLTGVVVVVVAVDMYAYMLRWAKFSSTTMQFCL